MTKLAPEWDRTGDPVIRSPARYRWTTAPALPHAVLNILISSLSHTTRLLRLKLEKLQQILKPNSLLNQARKSLLKYLIHKHSTHIITPKLVGHIMFNYLTEAMPPNLFSVSEFRIIYMDDRAKTTILASRTTPSGYVKEDKQL